jgi:hypothetical protein
MAHQPRQILTWKVWGEDTKDTLAESPEEGVARNPARIMALASHRVVLESPDGIEEAYKDGQWCEIRLSDVTITRRLVCPAPRAWQVTAAQPQAITAVRLMQAALGDPGRLAGITAGTAVSFNLSVRDRHRLASLGAAAAAV